MAIRFPRPSASLVKGRWHGEAVTEGFRPPESYPKNGIPQSASLTASPIPFVPLGHFPLIRGIGLSQGGQGTGVTDCHVGPLGLLAMTGFFDSLNYTSKRTVCKHKIRNRLLLLAMHIHHSIASLLDLLIIFIVSWVKCARQAPDGFLSFVQLLRQNCGYFSGHGAFFAGFPALS